MSNISRFSGLGGLLGKKTAAVDVDVVGTSIDALMTQPTLFTGLYVLCNALCFSGVEEMD